MFDIKFKIDSRSISFLNRFPDLVKTGLRAGVNKSMVVVQRRAKESFGQPGNLNTISGRLRSSITIGTKVVGSRVIGEIGSNVVYSRIHELSGYAGPNRRVFIRERPYLTPAFERSAEEILNIISESIRKSVEK